MRRNDSWSFDRVAEGYDFMDTIFNNNEFFLSRMPAGRGAALDVGCGSGILAEALSPHFGRVVGVDISGPMLEIVRRKRGLPNIEYLQMDAMELSGAGKFDYIVSRTTFHHIGDVPALLERLKELLRPGGRIALLDCASPTGRVQVFPSWIMAHFELARNLFRTGPGAAWKIYRFRTSKEWTAHIASDRYLTFDGFGPYYRELLPGCEIERIGCFMAAVWDSVKT